MTLHMRRINRKIGENILNKLSIIITYFNNEDYISECIHSLKAREIKILTLLLSMMVQLIAQQKSYKNIKII